MLGYLNVKDLGVISYKDAESYQIKILESIYNNKKLGHLILLEHTPVITYGKSSNLNNLLATKDFLSKNKIELYKTSRGGDFTLHSPGQLVVYPILNLELFEKDLNKYLRRLENVVMNIIKDYGIDSFTIKGKTGVWISEHKKICSIGLRVSRWITMHGLAFNINNDLSLFKYIIPCGIKGIGMTSLSKELNHHLDMKDIKTSFKKNFSSVFDVGLH